MKFIVVLQPKGWIATTRYMYTLAYTIQCDLCGQSRGYFIASVWDVFRDLAF